MTGTVRSRLTDSCLRLSIHVLKLLGVVINISGMAMRRGDEPWRRGESIMKMGDSMSLVCWVQYYHRGKDASWAGGLIRLIGVLEDRSRSCFHGKHLNRI